MFKEGIKPLELEKNSSEEGVFEAPSKTQKRIIKHKDNSKDIYIAQDQDGLSEREENNSVKYELESASQKVNALLDEYLEDKNKDNDNEDLLKIERIISSLQEVVFIATKDNPENINNFWQQDQVDKIIDILNNFKIKREVLSIFLFSSFTTQSRAEKEEDSQETASDLFAKAFINKLKSNDKIEINFLSAVGDWAQNIHMVRPKILSEFLVAILNHPEKISSEIRSMIIQGVGLFESTIIKIKNSIDLSDDFVSKIKNLEILKILKNFSDNAGFKDSGSKAVDVLEQYRNSDDNYFIKIKAEQIGAISERKQKEDHFRIKDKYYDEHLSSKSPCPQLFENNKNSPDFLKKKILANSFAGQLSLETGVIYNNNLEIDSFFDINSFKRLGFKDILEREGYVGEKNNEADMEKLELTYKLFVEPVFRDRIENDFGVSFSLFTTREQLQFIKFISSKNIQEVEKVKEFILGGGNGRNRQDRLIAFLSLEIDNQLGDKIIQIGDCYKEYPDLINKIFEKYAQLTRDLPLKLGEAEDLYNSIYYKKKINKSEFIKQSLFGFNHLFLEIDTEKKYHENSDEIEDLLSKLETESKNKDCYLLELKDIAEELNLIYNQEGRQLINEIDPSDNIDFTEEEFIKRMTDVDEDIKEDVLLEFRQHKKFSAERIREMIDFYKRDAEDESYTPEIMRMVRRDYEEWKKRLSNGEPFNEENLPAHFPWQEKMEKYKNEFPQPKTKNQLLFEKHVEYLQKMLPLQIALEKKMDQLIYGREEARLPKGFSNFENSKVIPENIPERAPLYFPVGISKDLPAWEKVLKGENKFAKPIDLYGYLFWLNNQGRKVNLVVCDEIQINNYQVRYGKNEDEARQTAVAIGDLEAEQYEKIINTFGLDNINIQRYQEFINGNKDEYERYSSVVKNLAIQPAFKEAFLAMVQESVSGAEKEEYIGYALEELTWILSTNGTKVGHLNEARYDILATVIRNFEQVGKEQGVDVLNNSESSEAKIILNTVCKIIRDTINEKKSKLDKNSSSLAYFQRLQDHLGKIKNDPKTGFDKSIKKDSLSLNFVCPEVGSASFGFRGDFEEKESVIKFKEPYSTYFYKEDSDLLINSDQVVAAGEGLIGGKILTLDNKKQLKYAESVVRPILQHYFANLEKAPVEYFEQVNKSREELLVEAQEATSLLEVLRFIQRYIVKPTELA